MASARPPHMLDPPQRRGSSGGVRPAAAVLPALLLLLVAVGCATPDAAVPDGAPGWLSKRPSEQGQIFGVGTCGRTFLEGRAREIAIARAAAEIFYQAHGFGGHEFEFAGEKADGTVSVRLVENGRTVGEIEGFTVVEEYRVAEAGGWHAAGTLFVLLRLPRASLE